MATATLDETQLQDATTAELVLAAQDGCRDSYGELADRFGRMIYAVCRQRLRDDSEAQEVSQEVLIKALEKLHQLKEPAAFAGWVRSIAVRQSINRGTRRPPGVSVEPQTLECLQEGGGSPYESVVADERADHLHAGLHRLGQLDRTTLVAFYLRGRSLAEMSDDFDAPVGTIKRRLHVARKRLAKELEFLAV